MDLDFVHEFLRKGFYNLGPQANVGKNLLNLTLRTCLFSLSALCNIFFHGRFRLLTNFNLFALCF